MRFTTTVPIMALLSFPCSAAPHDKRTTLKDATLYAYGLNMSGQPILFGNEDSLAYINTASPTNLTSMLSWTIDTSGTVPWNATVVNGTASGEFYIVNDGSSHKAAGFATSNATLPTNATTIGFSLFGGQVVFIDAGSRFLSQFWAVEASNGLWLLTWNSDGKPQDNSVPVIVKTTPPTSF
ncbi:hypothetical protein ACMFMG_011356 [Clarireedia jacksonii]